MGFWGSLGNFGKRARRAAAAVPEWLANGAQPAARSAQEAFAAHANVTPGVEMWTPQRVRTAATLLGKASFNLARDVLFEEIDPRSEEERVAWIRFNHFNDPQVQEKAAAYQRALHNQVHHHDARVLLNSIYNRKDEHKEIALSQGLSGRTWRESCDTGTLHYVTNKLRAQLDAARTTAPETVQALEKHLTNVEGALRGSITAVIQTQISVTSTQEDYEAACQKFVQTFQSSVSKVEAVAAANESGYTQIPDSLAADVPELREAVQSDRAVREPDSPDTLVLSATDAANVEELEKLFTEPAPSPAPEPEAPSVPREPVLADTASEAVAAPQPEVLVPEAAQRPESTPVVDHSSDSGDGATGVSETVRADSAQRSTGGQVLDASVAEAVQSEEKAAAEADEARVRTEEAHTELTETQTQQNNVVHEAEVRSASEAPEPEIQHTPEALDAAPEPEELIVAEASQKPEVQEISAESDGGDGDVAGANETLPDGTVAAGSDSTALEEIVGDAEKAGEEAEEQRAEAARDADEAKQELQDAQSRDAAVEHGVQNLEKAVESSDTEDAATDAPDVEAHDAAEVPTSQHSVTPETPLDEAEQEVATSESAEQLTEGAESPEMQLLGEEDASALDAEGAEAVNEILAEDSEEDSEDSEATEQDNEKLKAELDAAVTGDTKQDATAEEAEKTPESVDATDTEQQATQQPAESLESAQPLESASVEEPTEPVEQPLSVAEAERDTQPETTPAVEAAHIAESDVREAHAEPTQRATEEHSAEPPSPSARESEILPHGAENTSTAAHTATDTEPAAPASVPESSEVRAETENRARAQREKLRRKAHTELDLADSEPAEAQISTQEGITQPPRSKKQRERAEKRQSFDALFNTATQQPVSKMLASIDKETVRDVKRNSERGERAQRAPTFAVVADTLKAQLTSEIHAISEEAPDGKVFLQRTQQQREVLAMIKQMEQRAQEQGRTGNRAAAEAEHWAQALVGAAREQESQKPRASRPNAVKPAVAGPPSPHGLPVPPHVQSMQSKPGALVGA